MPVILAFPDTAPNSLGPGSSPVRWDSSLKGHLSSHQLQGGASGCVHNQTLASLGQQLGWPVCSDTLVQLGSCSRCFIVTVQLDTAFAFFCRFLVLPSLSAKGKL